MFPVICSEGWIKSRANSNMFNINNQQEITLIPQHCPGTASFHHPLSRSSSSSSTFIKSRKARTVREREGCAKEEREEKQQSELAEVTISVISTQTHAHTCSRHSMDAASVCNSRSGCPGSYRCFTGR